MQVDWLTVAAQIVNFLVLVWLLHRFLYGPIIRAMDAREVRIAESRRAVEAERARAGAEAERYRGLQKDLEARRQALLGEAREEADRLAKSMQAEARDEVAAKRVAWLDNLADEKVAFLDDIRERSAEAFSAMARRALGDLADARLEDQIARRFAKALSDSEPHELAKIKAACTRAGGRIAVRSSFDLTRARRNEITAAIRKTIAEKAEVDFEISPELICGAELKAGGQVVRWSLDSFLDAVETELRQAVESRAPESDGRPC